MVEEVIVRQASTMSVSVHMSWFLRLVEISLAGLFILVMDGCSDLHLE